MMDSLSLPTLVDELIAAAHTAPAGRSARTIHGGREHSLRQTVVALAAGRGLGEHESPDEATLQVLAGRVRLSTGEESWEGAAGDYLLVPAERHDLTATEDSAVMLTVANYTRA